MEFNGLIKFNLNYNKKKNPNTKIYIIPYMRNYGV